MELRRAHWALRVLFFVNGAVVGAWVPYIPDRAQSLGLNPGALGATLLAAGLGCVAAMPFAARLIQRFGSRGVSTGGGLLFPVMMAASVMAPNRGLLLATLFCLGYAGASMDIAMNAQGVLVEERMRERVISGLHGVYSLGGVVGSLATSAGLARGGRPGAMAAGTAGVLVVMVFGVRGWLLPKKAEAVKEEAKAGRPNARLLALGALVFAAMICEGAVADWSAVFLREARGLGAGVVGYGFAAFSAAMLVGRMTGDKVVARLGETLALQAGGVLGAVGVGVVLAGRGLPWAMLGFSVLGLGVANSSPVLYRAAGRVPGIASGVGLATAVGIGYAGLLVGPPMLGFAGQGFGLASIFGIVGGLCGLLAVAARPMLKTSGPDVSGVR